MRVVLALGGNALMRRGEAGDHAAARRNLEAACDAIAVIARDHEVVLVFGNGPQVGLMAVRAQSAGDAMREPLDVIGAETVGMIGYPLERELRGRLPGRDVVLLLTQMVVDADDPAFAEPTKPIGVAFGPAEAAEVVERFGWRVTRDGDGWRRVVASPFPRAVLEIDAIRLLLDAGHLVVCAGGGGVPVVQDANGQLRGVEAIIDKDYSAGLVAAEVGADALVLLTDARAVYRDWPGTADPIREIVAGGVTGLDLPAGSMGPKARAAARFVTSTGGLAVIGAIEDAPALLAGSAGTRFVRG